MMFTELRAKVFYPFQILYQSQTMGLLVAPDTWKARSFDDWADRVFPIPIRAVVVTLEHVATREPDNRRTELIQRIRQIYSKTILAIFEGWWEE